MSGSKTKRKKIALVLGTRPEIIKLSPILRFLRRRKKGFCLIHTGQHYTYEMDKLFFKELDLPEPHFHFSGLQEKAMGHSDQTAKMAVWLEKTLLREAPYAVLVQGDTNTVLAGSLVTAKIPGMKLGHVEAGLRSYDRRMPEEINRVVSDHVSDYLFAPTPLARKILLGEGIPAGKIFMTGNTIVDAVKENVKIAAAKAGASWRSFAKKPYFLMTLHRQENVDHRESLASIVAGLERVIKLFGRPILFPVHPRTLKQLRGFGLSLPRKVIAVKPMGFMDFLYLEKNAQLILTDSGGVQEEACLLKVPCVTLRTSTERPETVRVGANVISGYHPGRIADCAKKMIRKTRRWPNPFGDGHASERIVKAVEAGR
ncbi:MAG: UDP-N-acetylglucosamine 2-epimerase (non-hydrolyzing) [Candidatus Omnitrophica bacterium]|nr:UDP-N-acetylglucosamine 2-epimerase (non-hydrolyzing) [Candidatus Omnitrophota bacterium]